MSTARRKLSQTFVTRQIKRHAAEGIARALVAGGKHSDTKFARLVKLRWPVTDTTEGRLVMVRILANMMMVGDRDDLGFWRPLAVYCTLD